MAGAVEVAGRIGGGDAAGPARCRVGVVDMPVPLLQCGQACNLRRAHRVWIFSLGAFFLDLHVGEFGCLSFPMKWHFFWSLAVVWLVGMGVSRAQSGATMEPVVAALEPVALRTALARPLPESKRTVIVPAREDAVLGLTHYSKEEFAAAGMDWDRFMEKAMAAATRLLVSIKPIVARDQAGQIAYVKLKSDRPFTASVVLSPRMVPLFQGFLGERIVALMPDRNTVYLFSRNFGGFQAFGQKIIDEQADSLYPCSIEAFEISREGVKCIGGFDDGADPPPALEPPLKGELPRKATPPGDPPGSPILPSLVPRRSELPPVPRREEVPPVQVR